MASEFILETAGQATPEDKLGPRVAVGARLTVSVDVADSIGMQLRRGDGGNPEAYPTIIRDVVRGPFAADTPQTLELAVLDQPMPDFNPRGFQLRVVAIGGANLEVESRSATIATEPFAEAGVGP
jgi:hypothetical protein